ncbi:MAG TPA: hypothetical protein VG518_05655 [Solirubrobacterales bacterium]|nr:hypothetical protein [Solirubrobacterales bacterium]
MSGRGEDVAELRLAPESIEALATRIAQLLGDRSQSRQPPAAAKKRLITAAEVSELWGVSRRWVYGHAEALGAKRLGAGPRPRLRFDPEELVERLGTPRRTPDPRDGRRLTAMAGIPHSDSLSGPNRANVGETEMNTAGGRANAPGPASKEVLRRALEPSPAGPAQPPPFAAMRGGGLW